MDIKSYLDTLKELNVSMYSYSDEGELKVTGWGRLFMIITKLPYAPEDFNREAITLPYGFHLHDIPTPNIPLSCEGEIDIEKMKWFSKIKDDKYPLILLSGDKDSGRMVFKAINLLDVEDDTEYGFYDRKETAFSVFDSSIVKLFGKFLLKQGIKKMKLKFGQNTAMEMTGENYRFLLANMEFTKYEDYEQKKMKDMLLESVEDQPFTLDSFEEDD